MMKQCMIGLLVAIWFIIPSSARALGLEIAAGGWRQETTGDLSLDAQSFTDFLDVEQDLGYDDETRLHGRAKIDLPLFLPNLYLMAAPAEFDGTGQKNVNFRFGDEVFNANVPFYSKVNLDQYDVALYYGLPFLKTATLNTLNVEIGLNVRIVDVEALIRQNATGVAESEDAVVPIPLVYLGIQLTPLDWLAIEAEGRGLAISDDRIFSLLGRVRVNVFGPVFVAGGYRYDEIDVDEDDVDVDFSLKGPFAEVGLKF